jgi:CubicO group peptidase (beta-lactamase class C family)
MRTVATRLGGGLVLLLTIAAIPASALFQSTLSAEEKVDALFARWDKNNSPGLALTIVKDGKVVHQRGYGMSNLELGRSITASTVFLIASLSKQFTIFCILLLMQGGHLSLDDEIHKHVREVPGFGKKITLRHLVHHTSGLREYLPLATYAGWRSGDIITERDVLHLVSKQKELNFEPGSQFMYCNTGYELLGIVVERVSGQSLRDFAQERLFEPLGMRHTQFRDDYRMLVDNCAAPYSPKRGGGFEYGLVHHGLAGCSNVNATIEDLVLWDRNFYDAKVGGKKLIDEMHRTCTLSTGQPIDYAGGLRISKHRGLKTVEHSGAHGGFRSVLLRFPNEKFSVILLANSSDVNTSVLARKVADIYLHEKLEPLPQASSAAFKIDPQVLDRCAGEYLFDSGLAVQLRKKGDQLEAATPFGQHQLEAVSPTEFVDRANDVHFVFSEAASGRALVLHVAGLQLPAKQLPMPLGLSGGQRKQLLGDYYSDELEVFFHIEEHDGRLWLRHRKGDFALRATATDELLGDFGEDGGMVTLRFARNADKCATGFALSSGRVKNLQFVRAQIKTEP